MISDLQRIQAEFLRRKKIFGDKSVKTANELNEDRVIKECIWPALAKMWNQILNDFKLRYRGDKYDLIHAALRATFNIMGQNIKRFIYWGESKHFRGEMLEKKSVRCDIALIDLIILDTEDKKRQIAQLYVRQAGTAVSTKQNLNKNKELSKEYRYTYPIDYVRAVPGYRGSKYPPMWRIVFQGAKASTEFSPYHTKTYRGMRTNKTGRSSARRGDLRQVLLLKKKGSNEYFFSKVGSAPKGTPPRVNEIFEGKGILRKKYRDIFNQSFATSIAKFDLNFLGLK
jgi:hypothetical protein